jgi:hypothetical protein
MAWSSNDKAWRDYVPPAGARSTRSGHSPIPAAAPAAPRLGGNKFHAQKATARDNTQLDSRHEARIYQDLLFRERAGEITELRRQVPFSLDINGKHITTIKVDFVFRDRATGELVYLEAKSEVTRTRQYVITRKIFTALTGATVTEA